MTKNSILIRSKKAKAIQLLNNNQLAEADVLFSQICLTGDTESWVMRGLIHRKLGFFKEAEDFCHRALKLKPEYAWGHHVLGSALQCQGRMNEALACYCRSISLQPDYAEAHYFLGNALRETGAINDAAKSYREAIKLQPDFIEALSNLGAILTTCGEMQEAVQILNQANTLRPNTSEIIFNIGRVLQRDGKLEEALEKYQLALRLAPGSVNIIGKLAETLEKANRIEEAQALIDRELPKSSDNPTLMIPAAKLARRAKQNNEAITLFEKALEHKLEVEIAGDVHLQLGQLYDSKNETELAYTHFVEGNRFIAHSIQNIYHEHNDFLDNIRKHHLFLRPELIDAPSVNVEGDGNSDPIFLLGFARSGTTLLGQILDSHPTLQTLDEKSMVPAMVKAFEHMVQNTLDGVEALTTTQIVQLRKVYFEEVAKHIIVQPGNLLVDKMPLNTIYIALLWRVFPRAKIILAIRHPCDACLSCFMQNFATDGILASFFTLEGGAEVYASVMQIWLDAVDLLPLDYYQIRYEDLVSDFDHEARALLDFLNVDWNESVRQHDKHAMKYGKISTPSYHQVTQPLYQHAKFRWKRYLKHIAPVVITLQPYIDYFGYKE